MSALPGQELKERLRGRLLALGFDVVRFARVEASAPGAEALDRWLREGMQADMAWMARNAEKRREPRRLLEGTRTIVMFGVNYSRVSGGGERRVEGELPLWSRYSLFDDYHDTLKPALEAAGRLLEQELGLSAEQYRYYVDTGPVLERSWAAEAGLGFVGKNAMLISRDFGNWLFLSGILFAADLPPDEPLPAKKQGVGALCGSCTRCLDACPTQALRAPGVLDARRCLAYLTIENKGPIPNEYREAIGSNVYGCDICAEVCPWNRFATTSRDLLLHPRPEIASLSLEELLRLDQERFSQVFRKSPIKRIKLQGLLRNACVVAGNSGDLRLLPALIPLLQHENPLVRIHAIWAFRRLRKQTTETGSDLDHIEKTARENESIPEVLAEWTRET